MRDRKILRREVDSSVVEHADLSGLAPWHLNDICRSRRPRLGGHFGFPPDGWRTSPNHHAYLRRTDGTAICKASSNRGLTRARTAIARDVL